MAEKRESEVTKTQGSFSWTTAFRRLGLGETKGEERCTKEPVRRETHDIGWIMTKEEGTTKRGYSEEWQSEEAR